MNIKGFVNISHGFFLGDFHLPHNFSLHSISHWFPTHAGVQAGADPLGTYSYVTIHISTKYHIQDYTFL